MTQFISFIWFLIYLKLFLFWLWLWQLKEYHLGRFLAHFEAQKTKKILSSLWRLKYPKFTQKIIVIFFAGIITGIVWLNFLPAFLLVLLAPFITTFLVFLFHIPALFWRKWIIEKAKKKRASFKNLLVIGITGSYGKTSTKEFLFKILSEKFKVCKTKEHQNSEIGISQCVLNDLKPEHEIFIVEMGAYGKGGIKLLCDIVRPKIGILTGINEQHMATFGSQENIIKTKYELIESLPRSESKSSLLRGLPEDGMAFFNAKNKYCLELYNQTKIKKFLYGQEANFLGEENILGAVAVAKKLGMTEEDISKAVAKIENKFGGIQLKKGINGINIIDATYSANPDGVIAHLEYLKTLPGRKIIIMPCLIELGKSSKEVHKRIGKKIAEVCDLAIITTEDRFKEIKETAGEKALFIENPKEIFEKIRTFLRKNLDSLSDSELKSTTNTGNVVLLESRVPGELKSLLQDTSP